MIEKGLLWILPFERTDAREDRVACGGDGIEEPANIGAGIGLLVAEREDGLNHNFCGQGPGAGLVGAAKLLHADAFEDRALDEVSIALLASLIDPHDVFVELLRKTGFSVKASEVGSAPCEVGVEDPD